MLSRRALRLLVAKAAAVPRDLIAIIFLDFRAQILRPLTRAITSSPPCRPLHPAAAIRPSAQICQQRRAHSIHLAIQIGIPPAPRLQGNPLAPRTVRKLSSIAVGTVLLPRRGCGLCRSLYAHALQFLVQHRLQLILRHRAVHLHPVHEHRRSRFHAQRLRPLSSWPPGRSSTALSRSFPAPPHPPSAACPPPS